MSTNTDPRENTGAEFQESLLFDAQKTTWQAIDMVAERVKPGMTEKDAKAILKMVLAELGSTKSWHPPQIRFGKNTSLPFGKISDADVVLQDNDLYFLDIGPVFFNHEGDAGRTIAVGNDPEMKRLASDAKNVFEKVRDRWLSTGETGPELYAFAEQVANELGWTLSSQGASGHRVSDFPHAVHWRGELKNFKLVPQKNRWILEIHLLHKTKQMGAFYEDIL